MVPGAGLEPARHCCREILSLLCLPISPSGQMSQTNVICVTSDIRTSSGVSISYLLSPSQVVGRIIRIFPFISTLFPQKIQKNHKNFNPTPLLYTI